MIRSPVSAALHAVPALALLAPLAAAAAGDELSGFDCLIEPNAVVRVATRELGVLEEVMVDRGDVVKKGQVLARLESGVEEIQIKLAKARAITCGHRVTTGASRTCSRARRCRPPSATRR